MDKRIKNLGDYAKKGNIPWNKGKGWSEETKKKISDSKKGTKFKVHFTWKGKKRPPISEEWRENLKKSHTGKTGEKSSRWKGGISPIYRVKFAPRPRPNNCEICGRNQSIFKNKLHFDHDHKTGKFRGWICTNCNAALGHVRDDISVLEKLIIYLQKNV